MTYDILTSKWVCPDCGGPLRLRFMPSGQVDDETSDEFTCDLVLCDLAHPIPEELLALIMPEADQEFYVALERGHQVGQVWRAPAESEAQGEMPPPDGAA